MASYKKIFDGKGYISACDEESKTNAKKIQKKNQLLSYNTRIVKTKNGQSGKIGYTVYVRKK